jgi:hypothetical protein
MENRMATVTVELNFPHDPWRRVYEDARATMNDTTRKAEIWRASQKIAEFSYDDLLSVYPVDSDTNDFKTARDYLASIAYIVPKS